jgi:hypothetical protein
MLLVPVIAVVVAALSSAAPKRGHIFVLNSDVRYIACDAWLCPVDESMVVNPLWQISSREIPPRPSGWGLDEHRCIRCRPKMEQVRESSRGYEHPQPYLALALGGLPLDQLATTLRSFLAQVAQDLEAVPSRFGRALPLVALPVFGAGFMVPKLEDALTGDDNTGSIMLMMLSELDAFTKTHAIDVALCTVDQAAFGAAHLARRQLLGDKLSENHLNMFSMLWRLKPPADITDPARFHSEVERLADRFLDGQVSLFLGAGVSINAGLPSWKQLLDRLGAELGFLATEREALSQLNPLEAASVCSSRAGGDGPLKARCARILASAKRYSLQHALLAGLPFRGCVTTNYDELFETAVKVAGHDMTMLPAGAGSVRDLWCLKLHGTCSRPESIVLTRHDYARFSKEQAASEAVLQALLMTQHVLFVGFSMRDENWCRIVETVRSALGAASSDEGNTADPTARGGNEAVSYDSTAGGAVDGCSGSAASAADADKQAEKQEFPALGTMLPLECDSLFDSLWTAGERPLLPVTAISELFSTAGPSDPTPRWSHEASRLSHVAVLARELEIFLDHVASAVEGRQCRILLNSKYTPLLSPRSFVLAAALNTFLSTLPAEAKKAGPFRQMLLPMLLSMGLRTQAARELCDDPRIEGPYRRRLGRLLECMEEGADARRRRRGRAPKILS